MSKSIDQKNEIHTISNLASIRPQPPLDLPPPPKKMKNHQSNPIKNTKKNQPPPIQLSPRSRKMATDEDETENSLILLAFFQLSLLLFFEAYKSS